MDLSQKETFYEKFQIVGTNIITLVLHIPVSPDSDTALTEDDKL